MKTDILKIEKKLTSDSIQNDEGSVNIDTSQSSLIKVNKLYCNQLFGNSRYIAIPTTESTNVTYLTTYNTNYLVDIANSVTQNVSLFLPTTNVADGFEFIISIRKTTVSNSTVIFSAQNSTIPLYIANTNTTAPTLNSANVTVISGAVTALTKNIICVYVAGLGGWMIIATN